MYRAILENIEGELWSLVDEINGMGHVKINGLEVSMSERTVSNLAKIDRIIEEIAIEKSMSITGLQSGAFQGALEAMRKRLADKQTQGVAKLADAAAAGEARIDKTILEAEARMDREINDALQEFVANGDNQSPV